MPLTETTLKGLPFLGSAIPLSRDALSLFTTSLQDADRVRMRVFGRTVLLLSHPQDIEEVLVRRRDEYGRSAEILKLQPIFGKGLLASDGDLWRKQRSLLQPNFGHAALKEYAAQMHKTIARLMGTWNDDAVLDVHPAMMQYTREVICAVLFGDPVAGEQQQLGEAVTTVFGDLRSEILYLPLWRRLPFKRSRSWNQAVAVLDRSIRTAIGQRRNLPPSGSDLLDLLMHASTADGYTMSDEQLRDEILTFFLAGHETAALGLTWALHLLAQHPAVQQKVTEEVTALLNDGGSLAESFTKLPWTTAVVKEALRLYPPVWSMGRRAVANTELESAPVENGTDIWICVYRLHRDPRWYPDPHTFEPERWIDAPPPRSFTYLPFGIGPRVCIGQHFAMMESIIGLAAILSRFRVEATAKAAPEFSAWITLRPKTPIRLRLREFRDNTRG
ncbi:cytochrome P450 [Terriglobus albidus]|nr:cytochrome P450 [Terriglobus albidus]